MQQSKNIKCIYQFIAVFIWISNLTGTLSHYKVYLLCAAVSIYCLYRNHSNPFILSRRNTIVVAAASILFSLAVIIANHNLFHLFDDYYDIFAGFHIICTFFGGTVVAYNVLLFCLQFFPQNITQRECNRKPLHIFLLFFCIFSLIDLLYLWNVDYPGVLTSDSFSAVSQIITGKYNNTAPYWHTKTVELFFRLGYALFQNINAAVACFIVMQIFFVSGTFAYVLTTFYEAGFPKWYILCAWAVYALLPYNIVYSVTLWKDIPFGLSACLLSTSLYRIFREIGSKKYNYTIFTVAGIGFSLLRTNGFAAFGVLFSIMLPLLHKQFKKLLLLMMAILISAGVLIGPYLSAKNVTETDWIETLGIPFQQIACVIANERWLDPYEEQMLSEIFDLDIIKDNYNPHIVDPIKFKALKRDNLEFFQDRLVEYIKIWLSLGKRYPKDYAFAYTELTKGYWNGGYNGGELYWMYLNGVGENNLGIVHSVRNNPISAFFEKYFLYMEWNGFTPVLYSIGLHVWILIACLITNGIHKRSEFLLSLPCFVLILGLWIGTPVYAEFRYAYPLLISMPVILGSTVFHVKAQAKNTLPHQTKLY